jgi:predicted O-linked N-acetylglucosamine transferase (SPINDLY family)
MAANLRLMNLSPMVSSMHSPGAIYARQAEAARRKFSQQLEQRVAELLARIEQEPAEAESFIELAQCWARLREYERALATLERGLGECPGSARLHEMRISLLEECNQTQEAIAAAQSALRLFPDNLWFRLKEALLLPVLYATEEEIGRYRRHFTQGLARITTDIALDTPRRRAEALSAVAGHVNAGLGYQAKNDRDLQIGYGEFVHRVVAANYPELTGPLPMPPVPPGGKLRIGYISGRFRDLSATKLFLGWMAGHPRSQFDIFAYHLGQRTDAGTAEVRRCATHFRHLTGPPEETGRLILADRLHVLVFLDVGMKPLMTQVGAMRLAPIQCLAWDQPITSGLPTMDYFLSSALMEPPDADAHYSERLIRLPGVGVCFQQPVIPRPLLAKKRSDFRLREDAVVYLCCQAASKHLPQHDDIFPRIATRIPNAQFVFLAPNRFLMRDLQRRLDRAFSQAGRNAGDHCVLWEEMDRFSYWNLHLTADVFLDTVGWSGGVATVEAIACGLPVVTLPGALMRSNHSCAILTQLGARETIARHKADYVDIAVRLGTGPAWRRNVTQRMEQGAPAFYASRECVPALEDFYRQAVSERGAEHPAVVSGRRSGADGSFVMGCP